jgi:hypothetical protein
VYISLNFNEIPRQLLDNPCVPSLFSGKTGLKNSFAPRVPLLASFNEPRNFVSKTWKWYSYIDINATELVAAVHAIKAFFPLSLVLFGIVNILLIYGDRSNRYSIIVMLAATCIL